MAPRVHPLSIIVFLIGAVLGITGITLAIIFGVKSSSSTCPECAVCPTASSPSKSDCSAKLFTIRTGVDDSVLQWTPDLGDPTSQAFQNASQMLSTQLTQTLQSGGSASSSMVEEDDATPSNVNYVVSVTSFAQGQNNLVIAFASAAATGSSGVIQGLDDVDQVAKDKLQKDQNVTVDPMVNYNTMQFCNIPNTNLSQPNPDPTADCPPTVTVATCPPPVTCPPSTSCAPCPTVPAATSPTTCPTCPPAIVCPTPGDSSKTTQGTVPPSSTSGPLTTPAGCPICPSATPANCPSSPTCEPCPTSSCPPNPTCAVCPTFPAPATCPSLPESTCPTVPCPPTPTCPVCPASTDTVATSPVPITCPVCPTSAAPATCPTASCPPTPTCPICPTSTDTVATSPAPITCPPPPEPTCPACPTTGWSTSTVPLTSTVPPTSTGPTPPPATTTSTPSLTTSSCPPCQCTSPVWTSPSPTSQMTSTSQATPPATTAGTTGGGTSSTSAASSQTTAGGTSGSTSQSTTPLSSSAGASSTISATTVPTSTPVASSTGLPTTTSISTAVPTTTGDPCPGGTYVYDGDLAIVFEATYLADPTAQNTQNIMMNTFISTELLRYGQYGSTSHQIGAYDFSETRYTKMVGINYPETAASPAVKSSYQQGPRDISGFNSTLQTADLSIQSSYTDAHIVEGLDYVSTITGRGKYSAVILVGISDAFVAEAQTSSQTLQDAGYHVFTIALNSSKDFSSLASDPSSAFTLPNARSPSDAGKISIDIGNYLVSQSSLCVGAITTVKTTVRPTTTTTMGTTVGAPCNHQFLSREIIYLFEATKNVQFSQLSSDFLINNLIPSAQSDLLNTHTAWSPNNFTALDFPDPQAFLDQYHCCYLGQMTQDNYKVFIQSMLIYGNLELPDPNGLNSSLLVAQDQFGSAAGTIVLFANSADGVEAAQDTAENLRNAGIDIVTVAVGGPWDLSAISSPQFKTHNLTQKTDPAALTQEILNDLVTLGTICTP